MGLYGLACKLLEGVRCYMLDSGNRWIPRSRADIDQSKLQTEDKKWIKEKNQESEPLTVERRFYFSPSEITKEIALKSNLIKDLYIILNRIDYNTNTIYITVWVNYLVNWVWIGTVVIVIGGLISLNPFKIIVLKGSRPITKCAETSTPPFLSSLLSGNLLSTLCLVVDLLSSTLWDFWTQKLIFCHEIKVCRSLLK